MSVHPPAELDRRFYAFAIDRAVTWGVSAVAAVAAYQLSSSDRAVTAVLAGVGVWVVLGAAIAVLLGLTGTTPGMTATGLRVVRVEDGAPIGVGPALLRQLVLGVAGLPTFG